MPLWNIGYFDFGRREIGQRILSVTESNRKMQKRGKGWDERKQLDTSSTKSAT
jgi:hypothetical protein